MKVAVTASDGFVAPYIIDALGDSAVVIPDEVLGDNMALDVMLTPCSALIHINSRPVDTSVARDDRESKLIMREAARPVLDAVTSYGEGLAQRRRQYSVSPLSLTLPLLRK